MKIKSLLALFSFAIMALASNLLLGGFIATAINEPQALPYIVAIGSTLTFIGAFIANPKGALYAVPASVPFTQGICVAIQDSLNNILKSKSPSLKRTQVGYLQALISPQNTAGVNKVPIPSDGKKRKVRITYIQRGTSSDVAHTEAANCNVEVFPEKLEDEIEVTRFIRTKWFGFNDEDMRLLCESGDEYRAQVMNSKIDTLMVELNKKLIALQATNFGDFNPTYYGPYKDLEMLNTSGNGINYLGEAKLMEEVQNLDSTEKPIVVGAGNLSLYASMAKIGCCNDLGQDLSQAGGNMDFFRDRFVDSILGANHFIGLIPGYVQLLTWNKYKGEFFQDNSPLYSKGTIIDPFTGLEIDMKWVYDYDCNEQYKVRFFLNYDLWFIPSDSFNAADDFSGVNFSLHFRAVQG